MRTRSWRTALGLASFLSISATALADTPKPTIAPLRAFDFSAGMAIQLPERTTPVVAVRVPDAVYRGVLDPELADMTARFGLAVVFGAPVVLLTMGDMATGGSITHLFGAVPINWIGLCLLYTSDAADD